MTWQWAWRCSRSFGESNRNKRGGGSINPYRSRAAPDSLTFVTCIIASSDRTVTWVTLRGPSFIQAEKKKKMQNPRKVLKKLPLRNGGKRKKQFLFALLGFMLHRTPADPIKKDQNKQGGSPSFSPALSLRPAWQPPSPISSEWRGKFVKRGHKCPVFLSCQSKADGPGSFKYTFVIENRFSCAFSGPFPVHMNTLACRSDLSVAQLLSMLINWN